MSPLQALYAVQVPNWPTRADVLRAATALPLVAVGAGCTSGSSIAGGAAGTGGGSDHSSGATAEPGGPSSHSPGSAGRAGGAITLAFAGDINFTGRATKLLANPATGFGPIAGC